MIYTWEQKEDLTKVQGPIPENQQNILNVYTQSKNWEWELGLSAYLKYHRRIFRMAVEHNLDHRAEKVFAIFAALSPNSSEDENFANLRKCLSNFPDRPKGITAYPVNVDKALALWEGVDPKEVLRGPKTYSFYMNLLNPCPPKYITIDGHMISVWLGRRIKMKSKEASITNKQYTQISNDYRAVAHSLGILPNQLQATCWMAWKRMHKIVWSPQLRLWDYASQI